jgi:hypothetical protein
MTRPTRQKIHEFKGKWKFVWHTSCLFQSTICIDNPSGGRYWKLILAQRRVLVTSKNSGNVNYIGEYETLLHENQLSCFTRWAKDIAKVCRCCNYFKVCFYFSYVRKLNLCCYFKQFRVFMAVKSKALALRTTAECTSVLMFRGNFLCAN